MPMPGQVTDSQREEIRRVAEEHRADILPIIEDIVESQRTLHEAVLVEQPDETTIRTAAANLDDAIADAALLASDITVQIRPKSNRPKLTFHFSLMKHKRKHIKTLRSHLPRSH